MTNSGDSSTSHTNYGRANTVETVNENNVVEADNEYEDDDLLQTQQRGIKNRCYFIEDKIHRLLGFSQVLLHRLDSHAQVPAALAQNMAMGVLHLQMVCQTAEDPPNLHPGHIQLVPDKGHGSLKDGP